MHAIIWLAGKINLRFLLASCSLGGHISSSGSALFMFNGQQGSVLYPSAPTDASVDALTVQLMLYHSLPFAYLVLIASCYQHNNMALLTPGQRNATFMHSSPSWGPSWGQGNKAERSNMTSYSHCHTVP